MAPENPTWVKFKQAYWGDFRLLDSKEPHMVPGGHWGLVIGGGPKWFTKMEEKRKAAKALRLMGPGTERRNRAEFLIVGPNVVRDIKISGVGSQKEQTPFALRDGSPVAVDFELNAVIVFSNLSQANALVFDLMGGKWDEGILRNEVGRVVNKILNKVLKQFNTVQETDGNSQAGQKSFLDKFWEEFDKQKASLPWLTCVTPQIINDEVDLSVAQTAMQVHMNTYQKLVEKLKELHKGVEEKEIIRLAREQMAMLKGFAPQGGNINLTRHQTNE